MLQRYVVGEMAVEFCDHEWGVSKEENDRRFIKENRRLMDQLRRRTQRRGAKNCQKEEGMKEREGKTRHSTLKKVWRSL